MKKFLQLVLVVVVSLTFVSSVKAEVTEAEQKLVDYASQTFTLGGKEYKNAKIAAIVKAFVNDTNTSDENVEKVLERAKAIVELIEDSGKTDLTDLPADVKREIRTHADAIEELVPVTFDYDNATGVVTIRKSTDDKKVYGKLDLDDPDTLVATGADYTIYFVVSGLVMAIAAVVLYRRTKVNAQ